MILQICFPRTPQDIPDFSVAQSNVSQSPLGYCQATGSPSEKSRPVASHLKILEQEEGVLWIPDGMAPLFSDRNSIRFHNFISDASRTVATLRNCILPGKRHKKTPLKIAPERGNIWYTQGKRKGIELSPRKTASRPQRSFPVSPAATVSSAHKSPQVVPGGTYPSHFGNRAAADAIQQWGYPRYKASGGSWASISRIDLSPV